MEFEKKQSHGVAYLAAPNIPVPHAFTTRIGGASGGHLASLNLGENRGDAPENVRENYRRLGKALGFDPARLVFTRQVHGNTVRSVTAADAHTLFSPVPYEADGIVTADPGAVLVCFTADCVPVLLCDAVRGVIGAVHCGWRSSVADILGNAVARMRELGARREDIRAAIGPSIGFCCFEVGPEVVEAAGAYLGGELGGLTRPSPAGEGKQFLDLRMANARRLIQLGLDPANVAVSGDCTVCMPDTYWSHRYTKGRRGSQGAVIFL